MIDKQHACNIQISDFLREYKDRFTPISHSGMPGKIAYSTKLNREENCSLNIYLTDNFPYDSPLIFIIPPNIKDPTLVDDIGRVKDTSVTIWNVKSRLVNAVRSILIRLEGGDSALGLSSQSLYSKNKTNNSNMNQGGGINYSVLYSNNNQNQMNSFFSGSTTQNTYGGGGNQISQPIYNPNQNQLNQNKFNYQEGSNLPGNSYSNPNFLGNTNRGPFNNSNPNISNFTHPQSNSFSNKFGNQNSDTKDIASFNSNNSGGSGLSKPIEMVNLESDLNSKSIEELIYIYYNQEDYVNEYLKPYRDSVDELKSEVGKIVGKSSRILFF